MIEKGSMGKASSNSTRNNIQFGNKLQITTKRKVYPVEKGLKSVESEKQYRWHFNAFIKWIEHRYSIIIVDERLLQLDIRQLESLLIEYLEYLNKEKHLSHSSIKSAMAAVIHFCKMNDAILNRYKIGKLVPANENRKEQEDRTYTRTEIKRLYDNSDLRLKVVILLMANGMRVGAVPELELRDLTPISVGDGEQQQKVYQIWVYRWSRNDKHYMFVTPETAQAIDDYLRFRKEQGEKDVTIHENNASPLIREAFRLGDRRQAANPRKMAQGSLEKSMERVVEKAGTNTVHKVMITHGFRKWAITQMKKARVDFSDREYLVGHKHSRGLDVMYDRTTEEERLVEWSKAINNLTIDPAYRLQKELELIQGETNQKIAKLESHTKMLEDRLRQAGLWDSCD